MRDPCPGGVPPTLPDQINLVCVVDEPQQFNRSAIQNEGGSWSRSMAALGDRFRRVLSYGQPGPPRGQAALDEDERLTRLLRR